MNAGPDISILLVSWNTRELTLACLDSLPKPGQGLSYEIIAVDNASNDGSAAALARYPGVRLIGNASNFGFARAVNQAYEASNGEFVLLLNSDVRLNADSLSEMLSFLREHPKAAGVGPVYRGPDGSVQAHHYRLPTFVDLLSNVSSAVRRLPPVRRRSRVYRMVDDDFQQAVRVQQPSASCLLLRRRLLDRENLLDESYPIYFNDVAFARRLAQRGDELWVTPEAVVVHEHGASTRLLGSTLRLHYLAGLARYAAETQPFHRVVFLRALVLLQALVSSLIRRPGAMSVRATWRSLQGNPGPLPTRPLAT